VGFILFLFILAAKLHIIFLMEERFCVKSEKHGAFCETTVWEKRRNFAGGIH